jgi:hypothetical protein
MGLIFPNQKLLLQASQADLAAFGCPIIISAVAAKKVSRYNSGSHLKTNLTRQNLSGLRGAIDTGSSGELKC